MIEFRRWGVGTCAGRISAGWRLIVGGWRVILDGIILSYAELALPRLMRV